MTQTNGDTSPPDGYRPESERTIDERLQTNEGWLLDLDKRMMAGDAARNSQFASLSRALDAGALRDGHLADGLLAVSGSVAGLRTDVQRLTSVVGRLADDGAEREGVLMAEMGKVQAALTTLHQKDSFHDITLTEHKSEIAKQTSALEKVGASITWVNGFKAAVIGAVTAVAAHPTQVMDLLGKVLDRLVR